MAKPLKIFSTPFNRAVKNQHVTKHTLNWLIQRGVNGATLTMAAGKGLYRVVVDELLKGGWVELTDNRVKATNKLSDWLNNNKRK